jgi:hypothetical protein
MKYRIEFKKKSDDGEVNSFTKEIEAESDSQAIIQFEEFKKQVAINPNYIVIGLVQVELREVYTRILPRASV